MKSLLNLADIEITVTSKGLCVVAKHLPTRLEAMCYDYLDEKRNKQEALLRLHKKIKEKVKRKKDN